MGSSLLNLIVLVSLSADQASAFLPSYLGCFIDRNERDITQLAYRINEIDIEGCISSCKFSGRRYAGLQNGYECFCGDSFGRYGRVNDTECSKPCSGNHSEKCGGAWRNSVYSTFSEPKYTDICNHTIINEFPVQLTSPGYPSSYSVDKDCIISLSVGSLIKALIVTPILYDLRGTGDYLELNGVNYTFMPNVSQRINITYGDNVTFRFRSDSKDSGRGFLLNLNVDDEIPRYEMCQNNSVNLSSDEFPIRLVSPGYPQPYVINLNCDLNVTVPKGHDFFRIVIEDFSMRLSSDAFYIGKTRLGNMYKANHIDDFYVSSENVSITFRSGRLSSYSGFSILISFFDLPHVSTICDEGPIQLPADVHSPGFNDRYYPIDTSCKRMVNTTGVKRIKVEIFDLELESNGKCTFDYVLIDGQSSRSRGGFSLFLTPNLYTEDDVVRETTPSSALCWENATKSTVRPTSVPTSTKPSAKRGIKPQAASQKASHQISDNAEFRKLTSKVDVTNAVLITLVLLVVVVAMAAFIYLRKKHKSNSVVKFGDGEVSLFDSTNTRETTELIASQ